MLQGSIRNMVKKVILLLSLQILGLVGIEGQHYKQLSTDIRASKEVQNLKNIAADKILIVEFFGYWCHHCRSLQPLFHNYVEKLPPTVKFVRVPIGISILAKAYYMAEELGRLAELDDSLFAQLHEKQINLTREPELRKFFESKGVSNEEFDRLIHSFAIERKVQWGVNLSRAVKIMATPVVMVHGKKASFITDIDMAGSDDKMFELLSYLCLKANQES